MMEENIMGKKNICNILEKENPKVKVNEWLWVEMFPIEPQLSGLCSNLWDWYFMLIMTCKVNLYLI